MNVAKQACLSKYYNLPPPSLSLFWLQQTHTETYYAHMCTGWLTTPYLIHPVQHHLVSYPDPPTEEIKKEKGHTSLSPHMKSCRANQIEERCHMMNRMLIILLVQQNVYVCVSSHMQRFEYLSTGTRKCDPFNQTLSWFLQVWRGMCYDQPSWKLVTLIMCILSNLVIMIPNPSVYTGMCTKTMLEKQAGAGV